MPLLLFSFFARFVTSCSENKEPINKGEAELRLYWIGDNYPEDAAYMRNECNTRIITLHYILINNTGKTIFLPGQKIKWISFTLKAHSVFHTTHPSLPGNISDICLPLTSLSIPHRTAVWYSVLFRQSLKQTCI